MCCGALARRIFWGGSKRLGATAFATAILVCRSIAPGKCFARCMHLDETALRVKHLTEQDIFQPESLGQLLDPYEGSSDLAAPFFQRLRIATLINSYCSSAGQRFFSVSCCFQCLSEH
jgi:hypothetical protein